LGRFSPNLPRIITTDPKRLQQILKNLSNAFKFTAQGSVSVVICAVKGWTPGHLSPLRQCHLVRHYRHRHARPEN
jgi:signal transduction histidine kinase